MKIVNGIVASLVTVLLSFGAFAADEIQKEDVAKMNLTKVGDIAASAGSEPVSVKEELSKKADEAGGKYYVITSDMKKSGHTHVTAEVFK